MRLKFRQDGIDVIIAVTNVHYCKHADDEWNDKEGLSVLQQDMPQNIGMMFVGISRMDCNDIVDELLRYGYSFDTGLIFFGQISKTEYYIYVNKKSII